MAAACPAAEELGAEGGAWCWLVAGGGGGTWACAEAQAGVPARPLPRGLLTGELEASDDDADEGASDWFPGTGRAP